MLVICKERVLGFETYSVVYRVGNVDCFLFQFMTEEKARSEILRRYRSAVQWDDLGLVYSVAQKEIGAVI